MDDKWQIRPNWKDIENAKHLRVLMRASGYPKDKINTTTMIRFAMERAAAAETK